MSTKPEGISFAMSHLSLHHKRGKEFPRASKIRTGAMFQLYPLFNLLQFFSKKVPQIQWLKSVPVLGPAAPGPEANCVALF